MTTFYLVCAAVGCTVLAIQLVLTILGFDSDGTDVLDAGSDVPHIEMPVHDASWFFGVLSFRALVAAVAFFGLGGLAGQTAGLGSAIALMGAVLCGALAMIGVAWLMRLFLGLRAEGTIHIENAIGMPAVVYLSIPPAGQGAGKVTVTVQERTMEYAAVTTDSEPLPTGAQVTVVGLAGTDTVEVAAAR